MGGMTAITPITPQFSGTGTVLNPATGAVAGEVQWTDPADVPAIAAGLRAAQRAWRVETVVGPRTNVGAGGNYYHNSLKALKRMNRMLTRVALARPRRVAK